MDKYKIIAIIACIIVLLLIVVVSSRQRIFKTYEKYLKVGNKANLTGKQLALMSKNILELDNLQFALTDNKLGDAYSPEHNTLILSKEVCDTASLSSLTIVAHELGHAQQHKNSTALFYSCQLFSKVTRFSNAFIIPLLVIGLFLFILKYPNDMLGSNLMIVSGCLFALHALKVILNIPLEYDASKRALKYLKENNFVSTSELKKARKLLNIAAQTYIAGILDDLLIFRKKRKKK